MAAAALISLTDADQSAAWRRSRLCARKYARTGNPLYAWEAIAIALKTQLPLPRGVGDYLVRVASRLGEPISEESEASPKARVFEALEIASSGGPSVFEQRRRLDADQALAGVAYALQLRGEALSAADALESLGRDPDSLERQKRRRTKPAKFCP